MMNDKRGIVGLTRGAIKSDLQVNAKHVIKPNSPRVHSQIPGVYSLDSAWSLALYSDLLNKIRALNEGCANVTPLVISTRTSPCMPRKMNCWTQSKLLPHQKKEVVWHKYPIHRSACTPPTVQRVRGLGILSGIILARMLLHAPQLRQQWVHAVVRAKSYPNQTCTRIQDQQIVAEPLRILQNGVERWLPGQRIEHKKRSS